jgi:hypothetical protein
MLPDFELTAHFTGKEVLLEKGITRFSTACTFVQDLPYGRNQNRASFELILTENKGTCSSKHGFLATLVEAHNHLEIELMVGIFLMSAETHPKIDTVLKMYNLDHIPEAHAYFRYKGKRYDFTSSLMAIEKIEPYIVREQRCESQQLIDWKPMIHKHYLEGWRKRKNCPYTADELWDIREQCISAL